ncbi:hypothetical protein MASR2M15_06010 [Anaerolineales bacterium]
MRTLLSSISFRIGSIVVVIELIILTLAGTVYINNFSAEVDLRLEAAASLPARLMNEGLLDFSAVNDKDTLEELVGEDIRLALLVAANDVVFFSSTPGFIGQQLATLEGLDQQLFDMDSSSTTPILIQDNDILTYVAPIFGPDGRTPRFFAYIEIGNERATIQKGNILRLFVLGTLATVIATSLAIFFIFDLTVLRRIFSTIGVLQAVEEGDLAVRIEGNTGHDEISVLQQHVNSMVAHLEDLVNTLEERVTARTRDIEVAADVSARITSMRELDSLLEEIVTLTQDRFNLDQVSVFLYKQETDTLELTNASGVASEAMLSEHRSFKLDALGIVPLTARNRQLVRENDVLNASNHLRNPYLPDTQSELAIPMVYANTLIGVLDLQSKERNRFTDDDLRALTPLAEQTGIAIQNARLYEKQQELIEQLRTSDQLKSQFLASMSHELRTPLNSILTFSDLLAMGTFGDVNDEQTNYLQKILFSGRHLLALINDVLDISKMESDMVKLFIEDNFDVKKEVEQVSTSVEKMIGDRDVQLVMDIDNDFPLLSVDKRRVRQILFNLLSNAVKFTEEGTITLSVKKKQDEVLFAILDTGPGIPEDQHKIIFEPFIQTETGIRHAGGTGLGLPISKRLVQAHGGNLWLTSIPGEGSSFFFTLPLISPVQTDETAMSINPV